MSIIMANHLKKSFGVDVVLEDVSFHIDPGDKIALLGVNGAGKTTLFRLLTGELSADEGEIFLSRKLRIAYMQQHAEYSSTQTVLGAALEVFEPLRQKERQLQKLQQQLESGAQEDIIARYTALHEAYLEEGGLTYEGRARSMLLGLGFLPEELELPLSAVSGGQRTRVLLAKMLLEEPDMLLLDEPTNHLDLRATQWLEEFLSAYKGTVMVISHDRFFIDRFVNRIFELEHHRLTSYCGNYSDFSKIKAERRLAEEREYQKQTKEIKRIEEIIAQQKTFSQERNYRTIRSKQKVIERIEKGLVKPKDGPASIHFSISAGYQSGGDVLMAEGLCLRFDQRELFCNVSLDLKRGERAFLLGDNGSGKTSLFRVLLGELESAGGYLRYGVNVSIGYYDQAQVNLDPDKMIIEAVVERVEDLTVTAIRTALGAFLFRGDDIQKKISTLSGGEKARVALCILMLSKANLLFLDEPTNHLDIASKEALEDALLSYNGTLFVISHDRYFIQKLATKIYELQAGQLFCYAGGYEYYLNEQEKKKGAEKQPEKSAGEKKEGGNAFQKKRERDSALRRLKGRIKRIEEAIEKDEEQITWCKQQIAQPENASNYEKLMEMTQNLHELEENLQKLYADWEEYTNALEAQESQMEG